MDRSHYWKQLSRAVHWRLPEEDAKEVMTDYEEILSQHPDDQGDAIVKRFGKPAQVARTLTQAKDYYRWLVEFGVLLVCLLMPEIMLLRNHFSQRSIPILYLVFLFGFVISLIVFHPHRRVIAQVPRSRQLLILLLILMAVAVMTGVFLVGLFVQHWKFIPLSQYGPTGHFVLLLTGTVAAILGAYGLVQARAADRRWCALYMLGLAILMACAIVSAVQTAQEVYPMGMIEMMVVHPAILCVVGFFGMGVSLC